MKMAFEIHPDYQSIRPLIENIEEYFQSSNEILYDKRNQIRVVEFENKKYVIKSFKVPNLINRFVYRILRPSKAKRSYLYSNKIGTVLCPAAVAFLEKTAGVLLGKSYYISKFFDYDFTINALLLDNTVEDYIQILEQFADFTFSLHEQNIYHRDFSHGNILIKKQSDSYQFNIIDVNRMQFKALNNDERLKNFSRLSANDEVMKVVINRYSEHIDLSADVALDIAIKHRDDYMKKRRLKNKLRGR